MREPSSIIEAASLSLEEIATLKKYRRLQSSVRTHHADRSEGIGRKIASDPHIKAAMSLM